VSVQQTSHDGKCAALRPQLRPLLLQEGTTWRRPRCAFWCPASAVTAMKIQMVTKQTRSKIILRTLTRNEMQYLSKPSPRSSAAHSRLCQLRYDHTHSMDLLQQHPASAPEYLCEGVCRGCPPTNSFRRRWKTSS